MINRASIFLFSVLALFFATGASAQDQSASIQGCTLRRLASLDMTMTTSGGVSIPIRIAGNTFNFLVGLSGFSSLSAASANKLKLTLVESSEDVRPRSYQAEISDLQIGAIHSSKMRLPVVDHYLSPESKGADGILGIDFLQQFGVEFDFASGKLNLYEPNTCGIATVFWAHNAAAVPFELNELGSVVLHMQLDGKEVSVKPEIAAGDTMLSSYVAESVLGVKEGVPGFEPLPSDKPKLYRYPFKTLSVGGLTINNPHIIIYQDNDGERCKRRGVPACFGFSDMTITLSQLRALHLLFSFGEKTLYVTAAGAHL